MSQPEAECKACRISVRVSPAEVRRIISQYTQGQDVRLTDDTEADRRLAICADCPDLQYGTTCRHCGCLVPVRARLADKGCPGLPAKWHPVP